MGRPMSTLSSHNGHASARRKKDFWVRRRTSLATFGFWLRGPGGGKKRKGNGGRHSTRRGGRRRTIRTRRRAAQRMCARKHLHLRQVTSPWSINEARRRRRAGEERQSRREVVDVKGLTYTYKAFVWRTVAATAPAPAQPRSSRLGERAFPHEIAAGGCTDAPPSRLAGRASRAASYTVHRGSWVRHRQLS